MVTFCVIIISVGTMTPRFLLSALISNGLKGADQSCSYCGDAPINLAPLQREVSDHVWTGWFPLTGIDGTPNKRLVQVTPLRDRLTCKFGQGVRLIPNGKAHVIYCVFQFQQATMGSLLKYYREKIHKQRSIIEQFKKERAELIALRRCG